MWSNLLKKLIAKALLALSPRVDDDEPEPELPDDVDVPDEDLPEPVDDDDEPDPVEDDEPPARIGRAQREIIKTRERAQTAEAQLATARAELEAARRAPQQAAQPSQDELIWKQEDEVLRNPDAEPWQKYAVQSARQARSAEANSRNAMARAEDLVDKSNFDRIRSEKPKLYERYKDKVETMLTELHTSGRTAPREKLLAILVGEDMLNGKLKTSETRTTTAPARRASTAGVRSDVSSASTGRLSESEKREKRLENVRI
jgi:hypothetical protein